MSANNPVFKVLIPTGDQAILAAGSKPEDLAVGQIGVFSYDTGLSINAAQAANERSIFLAVGADEDGDTVLDNIYESAGTHIQKKEVTNYNLKCYSEGRPHIVDITNFTNVNCETSYTMKFEFRGNSKAYMNYGFNQFVKTFSVRTSCCGPGCDCPDGDCNELAQLFVDAINADDENLLLAEYIDYTTTPGTPIIVAASGVAAWIVANPGLCLGVRVTANAIALASYCRVPVKYYKMLQFKLIPTLLEPLNCGATVATFQEPAYTEGASTDVAWLEYESEGYQGSPYRAGELLGLAFEGPSKQVTAGTKYVQVNLHYSNESVAGWGEHKNKLNSIIAVPCTATNVTLAALLPVLDAFAEKFNPLTDDLAECVNCTSTILTSAIDDTDEDGLG